LAILDTSKKPFIQDRDNNVFIGINLPFKKSEGSEGYFLSTTTTIDAVKNNVKLLLSTDKGERIFQPNLGIGLRRFLFEPITGETTLAIQNEIVDTFNFWLPFITIKDIQVETTSADGTNPNQISINVIFNLDKDPNTLESVQVQIGE
jgi:phage baseplate assembly protein W